jgi:hypothetical protein
MNKIKLKACSLMGKTKQEIINFLKSAGHSDIRYSGKEKAFYFRQKGSLV